MEETLSSEQVRLTGGVEQVLTVESCENIEYTQHNQLQHQESQVMKVREFEHLYRNASKNEVDTVEDLVKKPIALKCSCSGKCLCDCVQDKFPVIEMIKTYKFKTNIIGDIIAGVSVGLQQVPHFGLSFALLSGLPPIYGLYLSFFPTIFYILFGSSRHVSVGAASLTSIMVHSLIVKIQGSVSNNDHVMNYDQTVSSETIRIIIGVTLLVGLLQVLMSVIRLGFVTIRRLSDAICHVGSS